MILRKYYFTVSMIVSIILFIFGAYILFYINSISSSEVYHSISDDNMWGSLLKPFVFGKDPINFLVLVGDKSEANTDTILLVNYDPSKTKLSIMSLPRDTRVNVSGMSIPKINGIFARKNGPKLLMDTVSELLNVKVSYYVYLNISTFRQIIDLLGGIDYYVPVDMDYDDPLQNLHIHLKKGQQILDGEKAEQFLRFRHPNGSYSEEMLKYYDGSDLKRIEAQQNFIKEVIRQKANIIYLPKLNEIINVVYDNLETNITLTEVFNLTRGITNFSLDNVSFFTLPGESKVIDGVWYYIHNAEETEKIISENFISDISYNNLENKTNKNNKNNQSSGNQVPQKNNAQPSTSPNSTPFGNSENDKVVENNGETNDDTDSETNAVVDVTKDNPSNSETSIEGSPIPLP
ncbi:MAG TPA: LCP family protein [Clostridiaceae bacterium]|nr:LCP family protein [Clostridiaceae bacterium]